ALFDRPFSDRKIAGRSNAPPNDNFVVNGRHGVSCNFRIKRGVFDQRLGSRSLPRQANGKIAPRNSLALRNEPNNS
ncbi:MAG TPA: hypothetical protein VNY53_03095, partial [Bradyrhizobium sp.]|nr:hypothetical protein [Bradyrhizobium sp.]